MATEIFLQTLKQVSITETMQKRVSCGGSVLHVGDSSYFLQRYRRIVIIGMGKAAVSMFEALLPIIEAGLGQDHVLEGVLASTTFPQRSDSRFQHFLGSHPIPNENSICAADAILKLLATCDESCLVVFLLSGGASTMVEKPLDSSIPLGEVIQFHKALVQSGLTITQMNILRKHFSAIKGGRLAIAAGSATQCTLLISDVPANMLHMVGSGPSLPDPSTVHECQSIIESNLDVLEMSDPILDFLRSPTLPETPKPSHSSFLKAQSMSLLSSDDLCREASALAVELGFETVVDNRCDDWNYRDAAAYLVDRIIALQRKHQNICLLSAGEVTVKLDRECGRGGRNQHFVLECARLVSDCGLQVTVLSGGSDGIDGNSPAAGAVCDETTLTRARALGIAPTEALSRFASFHVFDTLGDTIVTGPTGNNLRDLRILLMSA